MRSYFKFTETTGSAGGRTSGFSGCFLGGESGSVLSLVLEVPGFLESIGTARSCR